MVSLFSSREYVLYRFDYPEAFFHLLRSQLGPARKETLQVLDLGCGTGLVADSFLRFYPGAADLHLIDVAEEMLQQAKTQLTDGRINSFHCSSSDQTGLPDASMDLVLVGSAWHWMNHSKTVEEVSRILKPGGTIFIFEYQFPKTVDHPALNDWIRIQFNTEWKPSTQTPRGSLKELTECWRSHPEFSQVESKIMQQDRLHDAAHLAGVIVSQSRYQHYEQRFPKSEHAKLRVELEKNLDSFLGGQSARFSYLYEGYLFKKRV